MKSLQDYTVVTVLINVPAILGCHTWGQTLDEARAYLPDVFEMI